MKLKVILGVCVATASLMLGVARCDNGDDAGTNPYGQGTVTCVVDGVSVSLSAVTSGQYLPSAGMMGVSGVANSQFVSLTFPGTAPGTWSNPAGGGSVMYGDAAGSTYHAGDYSGSYTITVTACGPVDGLVEGTFSATAVGSADTLAIAGSFSVVRIADSSQ